MVAEGRSNNGITEALGVSPSAVEKYVGNLFAKLDAANRVQVARIVHDGALPVAN